MPLLDSWCRHSARNQTFAYSTLNEFHPLEADDGALPYSGSGLDQEINWLGQACGKSEGGTRPRQVFESGWT